MKKILVSYDLVMAKDYDKVYKYLKEFSCIKPLESLWLLKTNLTVTEIRDNLISLTDNDDKIIVLDITSSSWATSHLPKTSEWLRN